MSNFLRVYNKGVKIGELPNRLSRLFSLSWIAGSSEIVLVAAVFVLHSRYWAVGEHIVHLIIFFLVLSLWLERKPALANQFKFFLPAAFFVLFLGWLLLSVAWSGSIRQSLSYAGLVVIAGVTAVMLGMIVGLDRVIRGIVAGVLFLLVHGLGSPPIYTGTLGLGLFSNQSELSMPLGVGLLAVVFLFQKGIFPNLIVSALTVYFVWAVWAVDILTTVVAVGVALLASIPIWHARRIRKNLRWPLIFGYLGAAGAAIALFWTNRASLMGLVGLDATFSSRTPIWGWYGEAFMWRPLFGAGWGNSPGWPPLERGRIQQVSEFFPAHNGFIDTGLMLGGIGVLILLGVLISQFAGGLAALLAPGVSFRYSFIPMLVVYLTLNDLMATSLPRSIGIFLMGLVAGVMLTGITDSNRPKIQKTRPASVATSRDP